MAIREGKWKCPGCGEINRGAVSQCASCGTTRDANVKFFLDEDAPEVTDEEQLKKAQAGADWICEFCGNASPQFATVCAGCGAPKSAKEKKHGDVIPLGGPPPKHPVVTEAAAKPASKTPLGVVLGVALLMLLFCCVCSWFNLRTQTETVTVANASWVRTIDVEDFLPTEESAWDSAPRDAYKVTHRQEQRSTRQVQVGTHTEYRDEKVQTGTRKVVTGHRDLGNGHFEDVYREDPVYETRQAAHEVPTYRDEPVYGEKYFYTIDKWRRVRTEEARGSQDPAWPKVKLAGKEREGARGELYTATFQGATKMRTMRVASEAEWKKLASGSTWKAEFNNAGSFDVLDATGHHFELQPVEGR
jgi:hypothetical protein